MDDLDHKRLKLLNNPLSREFSVVTHEDLDHFVHVALPKFGLVTKQSTVNLQRM